MIRRLRADEVAESRALRLAALAAAPEAFTSRLEDEAAQSEAFWRDRVVAAASGDAAATFVAVAAGRHVGSATGLRAPGSDEVQLVGTWVDPGARRRGVGRALVEAVCDWAAAVGAVTVALDVLAGNDRAARLYDRCGFVVADPGSLGEQRFARTLRAATDGLSSAPSVGPRRAGGRVAERRPS